MSRFDEAWRCNRHGEMDCASCRAYEIGDLKAELAAERARFVELQALLGRAVNERDEARAELAKWKPDFIPFDVREGSRSIEEYQRGGLAVMREWRQQLDEKDAAIAALRAAAESITKYLPDPASSARVREFQATLTAPNPGAGWVSPEEHERVKTRAQQIYGEALFDSAALLADIAKAQAHIEGEDISHPPHCPTWKSGDPGQCDCGASERHAEVARMLAALGRWVK